MRRFICTPADLSRFEDMIVRLCPPRWPLFEIAYRSYDYYCGLLSEYGIKMDRDTWHASKDFLSHCTALNIHLFAHHVIFQLLESYDARNPKMHSISHERIDHWRTQTADCIQDNNGNQAKQEAS